MADEYNDPMEQQSNPYGIGPGDVDSGLRRTLNTCHYWIKGLPGVCKHWEAGDPGNCTYEKYNSRTQRIYPSGWNFGHCDFLGRRGSCSKYELGKYGEDLDQYICVAPSPFFSGLFIDEDGEKKAVKKSNVDGYNADDLFVGRCDGCGFGRGSEGYTKSSEGADCTNIEFVKLPSVCNHYRPFHMGFGYQTPKTTDINEAGTEKGRITIDERETIVSRLPLSFRVYNLRAKLQKCAYWNRDQGSDFVEEAPGLYLEFDDDGVSDFCTNTDPFVTPYHTVDAHAFDGYPYNILENVWSEAGCIVCNGAKSECPGYTGKWIYCIDERLRRGDKVSAQQVLELRFWMNDWASQEEYDAVFKRPPNKEDPSTSSIYTYGKWDVISEKPIDSILSGSEVSLCVPYVRQEFSTDLIQTDSVVYHQKSITAPGQVTFPNLIKDIQYINVSILYIIYPYASKDPFNLLLNPICGVQEETPCVKRNNSIDGDEVSVVGYTIKEKTIYAFNATKVGFGGVRELMDYNSVLAIETVKQKREFYIRLEAFLETLNKEEPNSLYTTTSDDNGSFVIGPIELVYQKLNELIICLNVGDCWVFRKRVVWSQWHGGAVIQCDTPEVFAFSHEYKKDVAYVDDGYSIFTPSATAAGRLIPFKGYNPYELSTEVGSLLSVNKTEVYANLLDVHYNYSYCIKKVEKKNVEVTRWKRTNNAGSLWIEIQDLNLCYIFDWGVDRAELYREDEVGNVIETVEMQKTFPSGTHKQINIHPNACIIKPSSGEKKGFFLYDDWKIKVDYWYKTISNDTDITFSDDDIDISIAYPNFDGSYNRFVGNTGYTVAQSNDDNTFSVFNIAKSTVALLGLFLDDDGRVISTMATKICVDVARVFSRDVEIYYGWIGDYNAYELKPKSGFLRVEEDGPFRLESKKASPFGSTAPCGDHDLGFFSNTGPMWFPYSDCEIEDWYDIWVGANWCVLPHEGTPRSDYRFVGPEKFIPWCSPKSVLWDCAEDWSCGFSQLLLNTVRFTGYARKRGYVDPTTYRAFDWTLPKFGNVLREYVERFRSIDNSCYISMKDQRYTPKYAWMPLVIDDTSFYLSFNCIDNNTINFVNPLNFWLIGTDVGEGILKYKNEYIRLGFDEIFGVRKTILASYPPPLLEQGSGYNYVSYYHFKDDAYQWAWQEKWKDIERDFGITYPLNFVIIKRPPYLLARDKKEHRFIAEEGLYDFKYVAPEIEFEKCRVEKYPYIQLGSGEKRYFEIIYPEEEYELEELVEWRDENEGAVGGSGKKENIYEITTTGGKWIHISENYPEHHNMIYDSDAVATKAAAEDKDRKIEISYDSVLDETEEYVYNRGIVTKIYKNRLKYLPYKEYLTYIEGVNLSVEPNVGSRTYNEYNELVYVFPQDMMWFSPSENISFEFNIGFDDETGVCISKLEIYGCWGGFSNELFCIPKIEVYFRGFCSGAGFEWELNGQYDGQAFVAKPPIKVAEGEQETKEHIVYTIEIPIDVTPIRMIQKRSTQMKIVLVSYNSQSINITDIKAYDAVYVGAEGSGGVLEPIKIWERKYNISIGDSGDYNLDGVNRVLSYEYNRDNSGVYFLEYVHPTGGPVIAYNKMRRVSGGEHKEDKEPITVTNYSSVIEAEGHQRILYDSAVGYESSDVIRYISTVPPKLEQFLLGIGADYGLLYGHKIIFESKKVKWDNHLEAIGYQEYPMWYPLGHQYKWSAGTRKVQCYLMSPFVDIMCYQFVHAHSAQVDDTYSGVMSYYVGLPSYLFAKLVKEDIMRSDASQKFGKGGDWYNHK